MDKTVEVERKTKETAIRVSLKLNGSGESEISTGIPFFDHMLILFAVHGFFDLGVKAKGDLDVDFHHTVEDVGLVLGDALDQALGSRKGIKRFGHAVTPMDDALQQPRRPVSYRWYHTVTIAWHWSRRPHPWLCRVPENDAPVWPIRPSRSPPH